jgi:dienelactone hydrolase
MAHVVLFHSILGLRPIERAIAAHFAEAGHSVSLPDLFNGKSTDDYDEGFALRKAFPTDDILSAASTAVLAAPEEAVLAGVSFGASLIGAFWELRPKMAGALIIAGTVDWRSPRRASFPVCAHIAEPDPFDDEAYFAGWAAEKGEVALEMHRYGGVGHYFLDPALPDYGSDAARRCLALSVAFLDRL